MNIFFKTALIGVGIAMFSYAMPVFAAPTLSMGSITSSSFTCTWGTGDVANEASELRYSTSPITVGNFYSATLAESYSTVVTPSMSKTITGLNAGTKYYVAYQYGDMSMGGTSYVFGEVTTASAPGGGSANLTLSVTGTTQNSISVSWNTDDTANEASELRYSTSPITSGNFNSATLVQSYSSIVTPSMSRTISGLSSGTTYYIAYKYYSIKNAGEMIATVSASTQTSGGGGGGGGGGGTYYYPKTFDVAKVVINDDAATTATTNVILTFTTDPIANEVSISNNINDVGTKWILYSTTTPWVLEAGDGLKTVYVKFRHASKGYSDVISDAIQLVTEKKQEEKPYVPVVYPPVVYPVGETTPGTFNILDFNVMMTNWNESGPVESPSDLTRDTKVDFLDVLSLFKNWVDINIF